MVNLTSRNEAWSHGRSVTGIVAHTWLVPPCHFLLGGNLWSVRLAVKARGSDSFCLQISHCIGLQPSVREAGGRSSTRQDVVDVCNIFQCGSTMGDNSVRGRIQEALRPGPLRSGEHFN